MRKMSLTAQAAVLVALRDADAVGALKRVNHMKESEREYLHDGLAMAAETLGLFAMYEGDIRALIVSRRGGK